MGSTLRSGAPEGDDMSGCEEAWAKIYNEHTDEFWHAWDKATAAMYGYKYGYNAGCANATEALLEVLTQHFPRPITGSRVQCNCGEVFAVVAPFTAASLWIEHIAEKLREVKP